MSENRWGGGVSDSHCTCMLSALDAIARPVCLSGCLSVRWMHHRKTVEVRIMKFLPYVSPTLQFLRVKFHPQILRGSPERVPQTRERWVKWAVFYF